ncbi:hypothetical protein V5799_032526 [Amblyomma americanum]|uniref:Uncharacterized protein n=1 Tax=Amblyomma americanum TaxID=6943 RepID=A0AAQ4DQX6_AMBAM
MPNLVPISVKGSCLVALTLFVEPATHSVTAQIDYEDQEGDDAPTPILAGWYDISRMLVSLLVTKPRNADVISALVSTNTVDVDFIDLMDRFWSQQPSVFILILMSITYMVVLAIGTPLYFWARSRDMMGGDRTQDVNEGYKFVLQALTIAFVICIAVVGLTLVITVFTLCLQAPLVTGERKGLFADLKNVDTYARALGEVLHNVTESQKKALQYVHNATKPSHLVYVVYEFFLPQVESATSYMKIDSAQKLHLLAELAQSHSRVSSMLRVLDALKPALQKNITWFIASNFVETHNSEITAALSEVPKALAYVTHTKKHIDDDLTTFLRSLRIFMNRLNDDSRGSLTALFGNRFLYYGSASVIVSAVLLMFFGAAFLIGVASHNETVPPTKRSVVSERSGGGLLVGIALNAAFGFFVVLFTTITMIAGILADGYLCEPYNDLVRSQIPDSASASVLDAVWDTFWNSKVRGKYFANLIPGHWFLNCDSDKRFIDLLPASLTEKMNTVQNSSTSFALALSKIQVLLDKVLPNKGPDGMNPLHYEQLRSWLSDTTQQISVMWANSLKESVAVELPKIDSKGVECMQLFSMYDAAFRSFCDLTLKNHNGWWLAMYICMGLLGAMAVMSHHASRYFLIMINYTYDGSEVESTSSEDSTTGKGSDKSLSSVSDTNVADGKKQPRQGSEPPQDQKDIDSSTKSDAAKTSPSKDEDGKKDEKEIEKNAQEVKANDMGFKECRKNAEKGKQSTVTAE